MPRTAVDTYSPGVLGSPTLVLLFSDFYVEFRLQFFFGQCSISGGFFISVYKNKGVARGAPDSIITESLLLVRTPIKSGQGVRGLRFRRMSSILYYSNKSLDRRSQAKTITESPGAQVGAAFLEDLHFSLLQR